MGIFDQMKSKAQSQIKTAARSAMQNMGNQRETFTFTALPESVAQMQALPEAAMDTPFKTAALAVCALCAGPFALLSVKMLVLKAVAAATDMVPNGRLSSLISSVAAAMGLLLGLLGCCGIMLFISIMAGIKAVSL